MLNLYRHSLVTEYRKLECEDLLFVEYECLPDNKEIDTLWSPIGHLVYVTTGTKTWVTPDGEIRAGAGEAVFAKSGSCIMRNHYESGFCALIFFIPVHFIQEVVFELQLQKGSPRTVEDFQILKVDIDDHLRIFFESISGFLFRKGNTSPHLLKIKFKELILQILTGDTNPALKAYFLSTLKDEQMDMEVIMRKNLLFNLSIEDYAQLCNRSVSSFKREFKTVFGMSTSQWILQERMKYAKMRLLTINEDISSLAFYSGYESASHFIRLFKKYYGEPPLRYKNQQAG